MFSLASWPQTLKEFDISNLRQTWRAHWVRQSKTNGQYQAFPAPLPPRDWHWGPFPTHGELAQGVSLTMRPTTTASPLCFFSPQWPETCAKPVRNFWPVLRNVFKNSARYQEPLWLLIYIYTIRMIYMIDMIEVYITYEIWRTWKVWKALKESCRAIVHLPKLLAGASQICGSPHELMTLIGSIRSKNSTFSYGTAWALRFRSLTPIMAPVQISKKQTVVGNTYFKVFFLSLPILNLISNSIIVLSLMCWKSHMVKLQN